MKILINTQPASLYLNMSYFQNFNSFDIILLMVVVISVNGGGHFSMMRTFPFHHLLNCF